MEVSQTQLNNFPAKHFLSQKLCQLKALKFEWVFLVTYCYRVRAYFPNLQVTMKMKRNIKDKRRQILDLCTKCTLVLNRLNAGRANWPSRSPISNWRTQKFTNKHRQTIFSCSCQFTEKGIFFDH